MRIASRAAYSKNAFARQSPCTCAMLSISARSGLIPSRQSFGNRNESIYGTFGRSDTSLSRSTPRSRDARARLRASLPAMRKWSNGRKTILQNRRTGKRKCGHFGRIFLSSPAHHCRATSSSTSIARSTSCPVPCFATLPMRSTPRTSGLLFFSSPARIRASSSVVTQRRLPREVREGFVGFDKTVHALTSSLPCSLISTIVANKEKESRQYYARRRPKCVRNFASCSISSATIYSMPVPSDRSVRRNANISSQS